MAVTCKNCGGSHPTWECTRRKSEPQHVHEKPAKAAGETLVQAPISEPKKPPKARPTPTRKQLERVAAVKKKTKPTALPPDTVREHLMAFAEAGIKAQTEINEIIKRRPGRPLLPDDKRKTPAKRAEAQRELMRKRRQKEKKK